MRPLPDLEYISIAETKAKLSEKLRNLEMKGRRFAITSHGRPKAVLLEYKEYISLIATSKKEPRIISLKKWSKDSPERTKIINSVSSAFDKATLSRKGQKEYKSNEVKKMGKNSK